MRFLIILAAFFAIATCKSTENFVVHNINLETPKDPQGFIEKAEKLVRNSRIWNGDNVGSDTEWPFVVEITTAFGEDMFTCSGSIININYVLSARDCVAHPHTTDRATSILSRAGSHTTMAQRFYSYANYASFVSTPDPTEPNFATIRFAPNFPLSPQIQIIRLPSASQASSLFEYHNTYFAGWGGSAHVLMHAAGRITAASFCTISNIPDLNTYDLCIEPNNPFASIQSGDKGGPAIIREGDGNTLIGVLDRYVYDNNWNYINMMFRIGNFWNFIHDTAGVERRY